MRVILDDQPLTDAPNTLAEAIDLAADRASSLGRVVIDVNADGRAVSADELDDAATLAHACEELRLTTAEPRTFVRVTLLDAREALESALIDQTKAADLLEVGSLEDGYRALDSALNLWQAARQALDQGAQLIGLDLNEIPLEQPEQLPEAIASLSAGLEEVRRAVTAQDWAGLGDLLRYDLAELVETWRTLLEQVAEHVEASDRHA